MSTVYLSLGSNLGDRKGHLAYAVHEIERTCGKVIACSSFYTTSPWGFKSDHEFINSVVAIATELEPDALLDNVKAIEVAAGRKQKISDGYEDRPLDIDILLYDDRVIATERLTVPHPQLPYRLFVLVPLAQIAPSLLHPVLHKTIAHLLHECPDHSRVFMI